MAPRRKNKIVHNISTSDVKLREIPNAWKPNRLRPLNDTDQDEKSEQLYGKVRSILNKLTPNNLVTLLQQFQGLEIDNQEKFEGIVELVFEKAIEEQVFSETYARFCTQVQVDEQIQKSYQRTEDASFSKLMINRCQVMFDNLDSEENVTIREFRKEINECNEDPNKKEELSTALEEEKRRIRIRAVGNMKFIGEFFKLEALSVKNITMYINHLLDDSNEVKLECLCKLLNTIGVCLEVKNKQDLSEYFDKMGKIVTENSNISNRIRFMLMDLIELRERNWTPRLVTQTIAQIESKSNKTKKKERNKVPEQKLLGIFRKKEQDMLVMTSTGENVKKDRSNLRCLQKIQSILSSYGFKDNMRFMLMDNVPETSTIIELDSILSYYPSECSLMSVKFNCRDIYRQLITLINRIKQNKIDMTNFATSIMELVGHEVRTPIFAQIFMLTTFEVCSVVNEKNRTVMKNEFAKMLECFQQYVDKDTDSQERCQNAVQEHVFNFNPKSIQDLFYQIYYKLQGGCSWDEVSKILYDILQ